VPYEHVSKESSALEIAQSIVHASIQALNDLLCVMNPEDYERAAAALIGAERIAFFGSGDSGVVALSAFQKFVKVGAICHTTTDGDTQLMLAALMNEKCVCLLVSHSGDTVSMVQAAKLAKAAGATTIAVTNFPYSHLAKQCDIVLLTATFVECGGELVTQRIAQLAIIESLFIIYRMRKSAQCDKALSLTDRIIDETTKL
jgi:DNA-binding MurR/RpiR family transcriptional regulator